MEAPRTLGRVGKVTVKAQAKANGAKEMEREQRQVQREPTRLLKAAPFASVSTIRKASALRNLAASSINAVFVSARVIPLTSAQVSPRAQIHKVRQLDYLRIVETEGEEYSKYSICLLEPNGSWQ